jgi:hypothetical protein
MFGEAVLATPPLPAPVLPLSREIDREEREEEEEEDGSGRGNLRSIEAETGRLKEIRRSIDFLCRFDPPPPAPSPAETVEDE